jgi:hypothetical protein
MHDLLAQSCVLQSVPHDTTWMFENPDMTQTACYSSDPMISSGSKVFRIYVHLRPLYTGLYCFLYIHYCEVSFEQS